MSAAIELRCRDACGAVVRGTAPPDTREDLASSAGWTLLGVAGGYRCGACWRALREAGGYVGTQSTEPFVDTVPLTSRGALPKATAATIQPPSAL